MVIVLADDFTGAAELAGVALRHGFSTRIMTPESTSFEAEINIIDTNSRSKSSKQAKEILSGVMKLIELVPYLFLYKKTDSVLRGHVNAELTVLLKHFPNKSILLVPANPSQGRTISEGKYFIDGVQLHRTVFATDPESPAKTPFISDMLMSNNGHEPQILNQTDIIPHHSGEIYVGEADTTEDLDIWTEKLDLNETFPAGGADFFNSIITIYREFIQTEEGNSLFVCGSSLSGSNSLREELKAKNPSLVNVLVDSIAKNGIEMEANRVADDVLQQFRNTSNVILTISTNNTSPRILTADIPLYMASIVSKVIQKIQIADLYIEGGTTASEIIRKIGWNQFMPINEFAPGVVRLQVLSQPTTHVTVKPGSYKWASGIWNNRNSFDQNFESQTS